MENIIDEERLQKIEKVASMIYEATEDMQTGDVIQMLECIKIDLILNHPIVIINGKAGIVTPNKMAACKPGKKAGKPGAYPKPATKKSGKPKKSK
jgi:hypothetical protein